MAQTDTKSTVKAGLAAGDERSTTEGPRKFEPMEISDALPAKMRAVFERIEAQRKETFEKGEPPQVTHEDATERAPDTTGDSTQSLPHPEAQSSYRTNTDSIRDKLEQVERQFQRQVDTGYFNCYPLRADNAFPTLLARLPIFRPSRSKTQRRQVDQHNALPFKTAFGEGKRYGPFLTVYDEDVLIALMRLRTKRIYGRPNQLPVAMEGRFESENGTIGVDCVICSETQVLEELGLDNSGKSYQRVRQSIKHLATTSLELNFERHEKYLGKVQKGGVLQLIHVQWNLYRTDGVYVVLFPPTISAWLENQCTYINWAVRKQLDPLGKCLHRFLESQPKDYNGDVKKTAITIGYDGPMRNVRQRFSKALDRLIETGWLTSYDFSGNGRRQPLKFHTKR